MGQRIGVASPSSNMAEAGTLPPRELFANGDELPAELDRQKVPGGLFHRARPDQGSMMGRNPLMDPSLMPSNIYLQKGAGLVPGQQTLKEREVRVRSLLPGGEEELPSEIRRRNVGAADSRGKIGLSVQEPQSAQQLNVPILPGPSLHRGSSVQVNLGGEQLRDANLSPETKKASS